MCFIWRFGYQGQFQSKVNGWCSYDFCLFLECWLQWSTMISMCDLMNRVFVMLQWGLDWVAKNREVELNKWNYFYMGPMEGVPYVIRP